MSHRDSGLGLVELLVAMSLTVLALVMFGLAFTVTLRVSNASKDLGAMTDQARGALNELDRQIRFGYWVKDASALCGDCEAVKVLTQNSDGSLECWVWAIDADERGLGRLLSYNQVASLPWRPPPIDGDGWHVAAGPEDEENDEVDIDLEESRLQVTGDPIRPLNATALNRTVEYFVSAQAKVLLRRPGAEDVEVAFSISVRNQWAGAPYAAFCGG